ncbi:MAG: outer membrane protein transport protein [Gammaproteobacteria bacterium]|nr:outer membrane protein transport protein [Gammaproteobacteria bacterium]MCW9032233.1 outer membrane protein transport protein [Gammaproteobacteria bacterium]
MKKFNKGLVACAVTAALTIPMTAMATNGYFAHGYGTKSKGLAGAGVALPQDAMAAATNPAGMVTVGDRMDLGVALFSPSPRSYTDDNPAAGFVSGPAGTGQESENDFFLIPHIARNWMLDADSSIGVSVYGNGGMNTEYNTGVYAGGAGGKTGINLEQLFINTTYSQKINDKSSWGASLIAVYQTFEATGFGVFAPFSTSVGNLTNNGKDTSTGFGAKFGWQGEVSKGLTLAASYQTEMNMSKFDKYSGLFAEGGDFDIPSTWTLGLAWDIDSKSTLAFDIQQINYSDVAAVSNPLAPLATSCTPGAPTVGGTGAGCLGGSNGAGFGYEDITVYKLGYQWAADEDWTWRVGVSLTEQPIPNSEVLFNIVAPAVMETHLTGGFTMKTGKDSEFTLAAMYAPKSSVSGTVDTTSIGGGVDNITIEMTQLEIEASWAWKF